jgi:hypothetical protein
MRLEREHRGGTTERLREPDRLVDHNAVAAVHAFEIADRHHATAQCAWVLVQSVAHNGEWLVAR